MTTASDVSTKLGVVIPTLDGGERFAACLDALGAQTGCVTEVVVVDSQSRDGTADRARRAGARVEVIERSDFDHGATRTLGARLLPPVDAVVFLVQDAVPVGDGCLAALAEALRDDVAAVTARQVAPDDASFLTVSTVSASPFASEAPRRTGPFARHELERWTPDDWRRAVLLDDVACAVRADLFEAVGGYPATAHGEDVLLAYDLLWAGWALGHEPAAVVSHGHEYDPETVAPRYRDDAAFFRERFGLRVRPSPLSALKGWVSEVRRDRRILSAHPRWDVPGARRRSRALRRAQVVAQRAGSRGPLGTLPTPRPLPAPSEPPR